MPIENLDMFATDLKAAAIRREEAIKKAKALKSRGFDIYQIARALSISPAKVEEYLKGESE